MDPGHICSSSELILCTFITFFWKWSKNYIWSNNCLWQTRLLNLDTLFWLPFQLPILFQFVFVSLSLSCYLYDAWIYYLVFVSVCIEDACCLMVRWAPREGSSICICHVQVSLFSYYCRSSSRSIGSLFLLPYLHINIFLCCQSEMERLLFSIDYQVTAPACCYKICNWYFINNSGHAWDVKA